MCAAPVQSERPWALCLGLILMHLGQELLGPEPSPWSLAFRVDRTPGQEVGGTLLMASTTIFLRKQ